MPPFVALLLTASAPVATPQEPPRATVIGVARARILSPAEIRRVGGRLEVRTGSRDVPTQVHRTERQDGGVTADFF